MNHNALAPATTTEDAYRKSIWAVEAALASPGPHLRVNHHTTTTPSGKINMERTSVVAPDNSEIHIIRNSGGGQTIEHISAKTVNKSGTTYSVEGLTHKQGFSRESFESPSRVDVEHSGDDEELPGVQKEPAKTQLVGAEVDAMTAMIVSRAAQSIAEHITEK